METRTSLWELQYGNQENDYYNFVPVESSILTKFQDDLNLLRCLTINIPVRFHFVAQKSIISQILFLECTIKNLFVRGSFAFDVWCSSN